MWQQSSFTQSNQQGVLYLVPTPIGNLEDMTFRAVRILKEVDMIAAEDTRQTKKLCNHFDIDTKLVSYHEHNKKTSGEKLIDLLKQGLQIAIVSDAGMPGISDPGYEIAVACIAEKLPVIPLPGANAVLPALVASGLQTDQFLFYGFLNRQKKTKIKELEQLKNVKTTIVFYEAPHRLKETLQLMADYFGDRQVSVGRELSKKFEEFIRGSLSDVRQWCETGQVKGEFSIVVEGAGENNEDVEEWWTKIEVVDHIQHYIQLQMSSKDAIKQVAKERGVPKRDVYAAYHKN